MLNNGIILSETDKRLGGKVEKFDNPSGVYESEDVVKEFSLFQIEVEPYLSKIEMCLNELIGDDDNMISIKKIDPSSLNQLQIFLISNKKIVINSLNKLKLFAGKNLDYNISDQEFLYEIIVFFNSRIDMDIRGILDLLKTIEHTKKVVKRIFNDRVSTKVYRRYNKHKGSYLGNDPKQKEGMQNITENSQVHSIDIAPQKNLPNGLIKNKSTTIHKIHNELNLLLESVSYGELYITLYKAVLNLIKIGKEKLNIDIFLELTKQTNQDKLIYILRNTSPDKIISLINNANAKKLSSLINNSDPETLINLISEIDMNKFIEILNKSPSKKISDFIDSIETKKFIYLISLTNLGNLSDTITLVQPISLLSRIIEIKNNYILFTKLINNTEPSKLSSILNDSDFNKLLLFISSLNYDKLEYLINHTDPHALSILISNTGDANFISNINSSDTSNVFPDIINKAAYTTILEYIIDYTKLQKMSEVINNTKPEILVNIINSTIFELIPSIINKTDSKVLSYVLNNIPISNLKVALKVIGVDKFCTLVNSCKHKYLSTFLSDIKPGDLCEIMKNLDFTQLVNVINNMQTIPLLEIFCEYKAKKIAKHLKTIFKNDVCHGMLKKEKH